MFLVAIAIFNAIGTVTGGVTLRKLAPSGVINQGILGGFSGKVGPVVGGNWKSINYMRSYVVPAESNTPGQQAARSRFAAIVAYGRTVLSTILQPFWDPFYNTMSGFNAFVSSNYSLLDGSDVITANNIMSKGTLEVASITSCTYDTGSGDVVANYDSTPSGNGLTTDEVSVVVINTVDGKAYFDIGNVTRDDGSAEFAIDTGLTATNLLVWVFLYRGTGSELVVSDSDSIIPSAV